MTPRQVGMPSISRLCMNPRCGNGAGSQSRGVPILVAAILSSPHCRALGGATKRFRMDAHPHDVRKRGYGPGRIIHSGVFWLTKTKTQYFLTAMDGTAFWNLPTLPMAEESMVALDRAQWIVYGLLRTASTMSSTVFALAPRTQ